MKARLIHCECGRNINEDCLVDSIVTQAFSVWCSSCGRRSLVDTKIFESGTYEPVQTVNEIDWRAP